MLLEQALLYENAHGVDAGRHVLEGDAVFFKYVQHLSSEADLCVHHGLLNVDGAEALSSRNSGDRVVRAL